MKQKKGQTFEASNHQAGWVGFCSWEVSVGNETKKGKRNRTCPGELMNNCCPASMNDSILSIYTMPPFCPAPSLP